MDSRIRIIITGIALLSFLVCYGLYVNHLLTVYMDVYLRTRYSYMIIFCFVTFLFIMRITGIVSDWENRLNTVCWASVWCTGLFVILNTYGIFGVSIYNLLLWFYGLNIAVTIAILISGLRHGIFKN